MTHPGHYLIVAALLAGSQVPAGRPAPDSRSGLIVGQVIDAGSNRPVAGAVVSIRGEVGPEAPARPPVLTGTDGRFVFRDLARGNHNVTAIKAGFVEGASGRTRPGGPAVPLSLTDGERRGDLVLRLWRHAAISGTVVDEAGERQVRVQVRAYRRTVVAGRRRFVAAGVGTTDDRGVYRVGTLLPGEYIVGTAARQMSIPLSISRDVQPGAADSSFAAEFRGTGAALVVNDTEYVLSRGAATPPPPDRGRLLVYPPIFHPFAPAGEAASVISLQPGQEHEGADIQITPVATVAVSGFVVGPEGPVTSTPVRLMPAAGVELPADGDGLMSLTDRKGAFNFPAVPSGHYALRLTRSQRSTSPGLLPGVDRLDPERAVIWVDLPLSVGTEDIVNLGVTAHAGVRVGGRLDFEGGASLSSRALSNTQIAIEPADVAPGAPVPPFVARPDGGGTFTSSQIPGGRYYVRIPASPPGWMFKSATLEGRDVADTPVTITSDLPNVVITFTDRWSGLRGQVNADRAFSGGVAVIVFPTDTDTWGSSGLTPRRLRMARVAQSGEYSFNLPPGDYYVVAVPDDQAADWQDVSFLEAVSRVAVRVRISEGERKMQDLRLQEMR